MKHWKWIASTGLVAVLAIAYATAEAPQDTQGVKTKIKAGGNPLGLIMQLFDADQNGEITRAELTQNPAAFDTLDANKDGVLSVADFPRRAPGRRMARMLGGRMARAADTDESGDVTEAEWQSLVATIETNADGVIVRESLHEVLGIDRPVGSRRGPALGASGVERPAPTVDDLNAMFSKLDRDDNGVLEQGELMPNRRGRAGRGGPEAMRGPGPRGPGFMADADDSGDVTADEWQSLFGELDQNKDGTLTHDELRPGPAGANRRPRRESR